ncbi:MAG: hypothetical protein KDD69_06430 [Bdellovibrionales bacterium]|nr:hypothetical protein [Bdellovibrionales bacterium]
MMTIGSRTRSILSFRRVQNGLFWTRLANVTSFTTVLLLSAVDVVAQAPAEGYYYTEVTPKGHLFKMLTGGLGSFVIIFMGFGGFATLFLTRSGRGGRNVPLAGVAMLLIAAFLFAMRVMVRAGIFGHEYIEW